MTRLDSATAYPPHLQERILTRERTMKINGNEIRPGNVIEHNNSLWVAVKTQAVKPGKGPAYNQVELKNLINGTKLNERFRSSETVEKVRLEQKDFQFLYVQGDMLVFMDTDTYEQMELQQEFVGERSAFLQDGMKVVVEMHEGRPIGITLPDQVTLTVTEADPVVKGQTAASSYKPTPETAFASWCHPSSRQARRSSSTRTRWLTSSAPTSASAKRPVCSTGTHSWSKQPCPLPRS